MKVFSPNSTTTTTTTTSATMATDVTLSHTIDDDMTFERVRHMPRRTQFVSTHRKLSWQYDKQMKQHERDHRISRVEMSRAKTVMAEKFHLLQTAKKQVSWSRWGLDVIIIKIIIILIPLDSFGA